MNSRLLARLRAFSLTIFPLTGMLFECTFLNQVKTASYRFALFAIHVNYFILTLLRIGFFRAAHGYGVGGAWQKGPPP